MSLLCIRLLLLGVTAVAALDIAAFNIQILGRSKMSKPHIVSALVRIIKRYDLVFIQEVRDRSDTAIHQLLAEVNAATSDPFAMELSAPLGRTGSKEQYAYFYRSSHYTVLDSYQVPEDRYGADMFERPPFVVKFRVRSRYRTTIGEFSFIGVHVKPNHAVVEIDALADVYDDMVNRWGMTDFIIGGDLNAGCNFVRSRHWSRIRLRYQSRFKWVIKDNEDTTIASTQCPYDRLILAGSTLQRAYQRGSGGVYRFDYYLGMSQSQATKVSDHVPVKMKIN